MADWIWIERVQLAAIVGTLVDQEEILVRAFHCRSESSKGTLGMWRNSHFLSLAVGGCGEAHTFSNRKKALEVSMNSILQYILECPDFE